MYLFKVTPTNGPYKAPCMYIEADKEQRAIEIAKEQSGLGRFTAWIFVAKQLKEAKTNRKQFNAA